MIKELSVQTKQQYEGFCEFVKEYVDPYANEWDRQQQMPAQIIHEIGKAGYLGAIIPKKYGGQDWDFVTFGLLNEAFGGGSSSLTVLFTVQNMVASSLLRWGTLKQLEKWMEPMARGEIIASFAITEPSVGSNIQCIETNFVQKNDTYILNGVKRWITFAEVADIFLVFGKLGDKSTACIVTADMPGLKITPIKNMLGFKSAHLAEVEFNDVEIPKENIIGRPGFALSHVAPLGLHCGRLSTAFSSAGLLRACLETCVERASSRMVLNSPLDNLSPIRNTIAQMGMNYDTAMLLCLNAAEAENDLSPSSIEKTMLAKCFSSRSVVDAATQTVQLLGAHGCHEDSSNGPRYYRDSKIMEIIEGTNQVLQNVLGSYYINNYKKESLLVY